MQAIKIKAQFIYYLMAQSTAALFYYSGMSIVLFKPVALPATWFDRVIPFHMLSAWLYLSFFFLIMLAIVGTNRSASRQCALAIGLNSLVAFLFFIVFPTKIPDFDYAQTPGMSTAIMQWIRQSDRNQNCFPSMHIANALTAVYFFNGQKKPAIKFLCWLWFTLIAYSVISTRQHCFYDIPGGMVLAVVNVAMVKWLIRRSPDGSKVRQDP